MLSGIIFGENSIYKIVLHV